MWQNKSVALVEIHNIRQQMDQVKERLLTSSYGSVQNFVYCTLDYAYSWSSAGHCYAPFVGCSNVHTVKSTVQKMNTPVLIPFRTWVHTIFSCLWTVLPFLTWLYTRFWLYMMQKHPYFEKHSLSLQTRLVIHFATIYDRLSLTHESRMTIHSSTLNRIESRRFISVKISAELDI